VHCAVKSEPTLTSTNILRISSDLWGQINNDLSCGFTLKATSQCIRVHVQRPAHVHIRFKLFASSLLSHKVCFETTTCHVSSVCWLNLTVEIWTYSCLCFDRLRLSISSKPSLARLAGIVFQRLKISRDQRSWILMTMPPSSVRTEVQSWKRRSVYATPVRKNITEIKGWNYHFCRIEDAATISDKRKHELYILKFYDIVVWKCIIFMLSCSQSYHYIISSHHTSRQLRQMAIRFAQAHAYSIIVITVNFREPRPW
jgi:hypothetical protein